MSLSEEPDHADLGGAGALRVVEVDDERSPEAAQALDLIESAFRREDRQPMDEMRSAIAEKRLGLTAADEFHLLVLTAPDRPIAGAAVGVFLASVNAGFITYLAVRAEHRGQGYARVLRGRLIELFREDARRTGRDEVSWVIGEVRSDNPWLKGLIRRRGAIPFDLTYYHPGMRPGRGDPPFTLYRQPIGDRRVELPVDLIRQTLYALYRRGYRIRHPLQHEAFDTMLRELEGRETVGAAPGFDGPGG